MGLRSLLARAAARRAHVLIAEAPGAFRARVALENELAMLGWPRTDSVADADVLAVVGQPTEELAQVFGHVWDQMSEPRTRMVITSDADIDQALHCARDALAAAAHGADVRRADQHRGDSQDHGGHEGHDHGDMAPDGIPLASGAQDRDGLEMDELHLPLGPVLRYWPPGITLTLTLHGDVVADASVGDLAGDRRENADQDEHSARLLDAAHAALSLAGVTGLAARARQARDRSLSGASDIDRNIDDLAKGLHRARILRWSLRGLVPPGELPADALYDRIRALVEDARSRHGDAGHRPNERGMTRSGLPELMRGQELSAVRLWMATMA